MMNSEIKQVTLDDMFPLMEEQLKNGGTVVFKPKGISMLPLIRQGIDSVSIAPFQGNLKKYDIPLYRRKDKSFILHRVVKVCSDKTYVMCGDNQTVLEYGISDSNIIGIVTGIYRGKKFIPVKSVRFWLYSRFVPLRRAWRTSFFRRAMRWGLRKCKILK